MALKRVSKKMSSTLSSSHAEGVTFQIGDRFNTFEELECKLKLYENATSTKFWMLLGSEPLGLYLILSSTIRFHTAVFMGEENLCQRENESAQHCK